MLFKYKAIDSANVQREGTVSAASVDAAITAVQKRGYTLISINQIDEGTNLSDLFNLEIALFQSVSNKELVILTRQIATLFAARVAPLRIFQLLSE